MLRKMARLGSSLKLCGLLLSLAILVCPIQAGAMRERQALEAFELASLRLEAVYLSDLCKPYASVRDPGGYLHRAFKGDYLGKYFGQVVELSEKGIKLREVFESKEGEWVERESWMPVNPLAPQNGIK